MYASFFQQVSKMWHSHILVHSRIDLAATGFVLLCDASIRTAKANNTIDVPGTFQKLMDSSVGLIITSEDYELAHLVIVEHLLADDISTNLISMDFSISLSEFGKCAKYLKETLWLDQYSPKKRENNIRSSVATPSKLMLTYFQNLFCTTLFQRMSLTFHLNLFQVRQQILTLLMVNLWVLSNVLINF
jgi:hypothetical protein